MKEADIRPAALFDRYLALCRSDAKTFFEPSEWEPVGCPACGADGTAAFVKHGFSYRACPECDTLFASPRPTAAALARYYTESPSAKFWATDFYRTTEDARRERMFRPRAQRVRELTAGAGDPDAVVDIGGGYGVFCEEIQKQLPAARVCAIEPSPALGAVCRAKGFTVVPAFLEQVSRADLPLDGGRAVFTSFELFEHLHTPRLFLERCRALMRGEDTLVLTTLSGTGFDIQLLWERAKAVFPPHHLNFLNPWSIERLARDCGFDDVVVTTPGRLDVDIVKNDGSASGASRFLRTAARRAGEGAEAALQGWIQQHRLSSHMMMVARVGER